MLDGNATIMRRCYKAILKWGAAVFLLILLLGWILWLGRTSLILRLAAWQTGRKAVATETRNGLKPEFEMLPAGWIPQMCQPMDGIWTGLGLKGMNYFSFGGPAHRFDDYSARSDPSSPLYQAWFGVYVIAGHANWVSADGTITGSELARVAEFDQNAWLGAMGDTKPQTEFVASEKPESVKIAGKVRPLIVATFRSHSDLNTNKSKLAELVGMPRQEQWNRDLDSYHNVLLTGFLSAWYEPAKDVTIVVYANGAGYKTRNGREVDCFPALRKDFISLMSALEFKRSR